MAKPIDWMPTAIAALLSGCAPSLDPPTGSVGSSMPWRLQPVSAESRARGEETRLAYVTGLGFVRGTERALAYFNAPLESLVVPRGRNRTVQPCRDAAEAQARSLGAVRVEAVSAGPERRTREGYEGLVAIRILYQRPTGYEVRQAVLTCRVDPRGGLIGAAVAQAV